ncbi:transposase, partial [Massilia mucilaginosa]|uniref:transposase n=1 Tax=Massilia mucilaginosa TaxID=2609282 RepID=UPI001CB6E7C6
LKAGASESIFDAVNRQLSRHGYIARGGQMVDASIVQAPKQSMSKEEKALVGEGAMPIDWKPAKRRQKDMDARWTKKHGKSYFGYKVSANADKRYKLVRKIKVSTASEHDTFISRRCSIPRIPIATSWQTKATWMARARTG